MPSILDATKRAWVVRSLELDLQRSGSLVNLAAVATFCVTGVGSVCLCSSRRFFHDRVDCSGAFSAARRTAKARINLARMTRAVRARVKTGANGGVRQAVAGTNDHQKLSLERLKTDLLSTT